MIETQISQEIFISFAGTLLALLSAGVVWLLKSAFDKHRSEIIALAKYERGLATNLEILYDNFGFLDRWIDSIKNNNRPFSAHFEKYIIDDNEHYKIADLELINQIVQLNYKLRRSASDFEHLQNSYLRTLTEIDSITNPTNRIDNLTAFHQSFVVGLEQIKANRAHLEKEILKAIARIRLDSDVRKYSLFNLSFLFKDVWPRASQNRFDVEHKRLCKEVEERKQTCKK